MGVEGRERDKTLDAGASVISGQLGKTIQRLRKAYNLSLSELAEQSGVAKSIISQIERNETNPTLATIWRLAQALDVSIERVLQAADDEPFLEKSTRADTPILVSDDGKMPARHHRLDQDGRMAAMVRFLTPIPAACSNPTRISAARSSASRCSRASSRSRSATSSERAKRRRDAALPLRPAARHPQRVGEARHMPRWSASSKPR